MLVYVFLTQIALTVACMPGTNRLYGYVPRLWWSRTTPNSSDVNQIPTPDVTPASDLQVEGSNVYSRQVTPIPLLPIRQDYTPFYRRYFAVVASPEIPMPKPVFVTPYSPPRVLQPPTTEDPKVLWDKVLNLKRDQERAPTPSRWWIPIISSPQAKKPEVSTNTDLLNNEKVSDNAISEKVSSSSADDLSVDCSDVDVVTDKPSNGFTESANETVVEKNTTQLIDEEEDTKFQRPTVPADEQTTETVNSEPYIQTLPVNSVIVVVDDERPQQYSTETPINSNVTESTTTTEVETTTITDTTRNESLTEIFDSTTATFSAETETSTDAIIPSTVPQLNFSESIETVSSFDDNQTDPTIQLVDNPTESTSEPITELYSTTDTTEAHSTSTEAQEPVIHVLNNTTVVDSFQGSMFASITETPHQATAIPEPTVNYTRVVNEEDVIIDNIPQSRPTNEDKNSAMTSHNMLSSVLEIINASRRAEPKGKILQFSSLDAFRVRKPAIDIASQIESSTPEAYWIAEGVLLPNGSSVIIPKEGVRGVPSVLPLPPPPEGVTVNLERIEMRRQRLRDGKKIFVATLEQDKPEKPSIVYYYWKQPRTRQFHLLNDRPTR